MLSEWTAYSFAAVIGLCIGSFYTASASRILYFFYGPGRKETNRWKSFFTRPSFCMHCQTRIALFDIAPLFGYIFTKGRCRNCGTRIGLLTLLGELLPGLLLPLQLKAGFGWPAALTGTILCGQLYISAATDSKYLLLDHENTAILFLLALAGSVFKTGADWDSFRVYLLTGSGVFAVFLLLFFAGRMRSLGFADCLLAAILSLFSGMPWCLIMFQAASVGAILFIVFIKKSKKSPAPYGMFLASGLYISMIAESLWRIYWPYT